MQSQFPAVNKLISPIEKVFLRVPLHMKRYRNKLQNMPLSYNNKMGNLTQSNIFLCNAEGIIYI